MVNGGKVYGDDYYESVYLGVKDSHDARIISNDLDYGERVDNLGLCHLATDTC
jgi:hypothetical protein